MGRISTSFTDDIFLCNESVFLRIPETSASQIPEYLSEGRRFEELLRNYPYSRSVRASQSNAQIL